MMEGLIFEGIITQDALDGIAPEPEVLHDPEVTPDWAKDLPVNG